MIETVTNPHAVSVLHAVVALTLWSLVMFLWMYATRLPAMKAMNPQDAAHTHALRGRLPSRVEAVSDNYNHLFEAPTAFYAIAFAVVLLGLADPLHVACAWAFVVLRVVHSLVQATFNRVVIRFLVFSLSWLAMAVMMVRAALASF
jgi:hypothetical protein